MNLFSNHVRSLVFQYRIDSRIQLPRHCHNGDAGAFAAGVSPANRTVKLSKLGVLADRRPGSLNELASKPCVAGAGDRAPIETRSPVEFSVGTKPRSFPVAGHCRFHASLQCAPEAG